MSDLIRDDLLERLRELADIEHRSVDDVLTDMLEQYTPVSDDDDDYPDEEATYESERLTRILGDALNPDGSIDVAKLDARTKPITLEELFPEGDLDDAS